MIVETGLWEIIKELAGWLWVPVGAVMTFVYRDYAEHKNKTIQLEQRVIKLEIQYSDLKEDLTEIKSGVEKLVDHLLDKGK